MFWPILGLIGRFLGQKWLFLADFDPILPYIILWDFWIFRLQSTIPLLTFTVITFEPTRRIWKSRAFWKLEISGYLFITKWKKSEKRGLPPLYYSLNRNYSENKYFMRLCPNKVIWSQTPKNWRFLIFFIFSDLQSSTMFLSEF